MTPRNEVKFVEMPMAKTLFLNRARSSMGEEARFSHHIKAARQRTNVAAARMMGGELHPMFEPFETARRNVKSMAVERAAPGKS